MQRGPLLPTPTQVAERQALRGRFLSAMWDAENAGTNMPAVADVLATIEEDHRAEADVRQLVGGLIQDGLLSAGLGRKLASIYSPRVLLTSAGRAEVERWLTEPDRPTEHLAVPAATVFNNYGTVQGSSVVQGSPNSAVTVISNAQGQQLAGFAQQYRKVLDAIDLCDDAREDVEGDLRTLEEQATADSPDASRLRPAIRRLLGWLGATAGVGVGSVAKAEIESGGHALLQALGAS